MVNYLDDYKDAYEETYVLDNKLMLEWYPHRVVSVAAGNSVLELGLGHGYSSAVFSRSFSRYMVVEGSKIMMERFRENHPDLKVNMAHSYFEDFSIDEKFDNIMMGFVLEHVEDPNLILTRYKQLLKPDGSIFIAVPNSESLHRRFGHAAGLLPDMTALSPADHDFGHRRYFNLKTLTELVNRNGYSVRLTEGLLLKSITTQQIMDLGLSDEVLKGMMEVAVDYPELSNAILMQIQVAS